MSAFGQNVFYIKFLLDSSYKKIWGLRPGLPGISIFRMSFYNDTYFLLPPWCDYCLYRDRSKHQQNFHLRFFFLRKFRDLQVQAPLLAESGLSPHWCDLLPFNGNTCWRNWNKPNSKKNELEKTNLKTTNSKTTNWNKQTNKTEICKIKKILRTGL